MHIPAFAVTSVLVVILLAYEGMRPNPKFVRIWMGIAIAAIVGGCAVLMFPQIFPSETFKDILQSCCLVIFVSYFLREVLKSFFGLFRYREERDSMMHGVTVTKRPSAPHRSGTASKKKKRKK